MAGGAARPLLKAAMKAMSPQGAGAAVDENAARLSELAYQYIDNGATLDDFMIENMGVYNREVMEGAWQKAEQEKKMYNEAAKMFLTGPRDMAAFHAIDTWNLFDSIEKQGIPSPSIGITRDPAILNEFGDWRLVMNPSAFNPERGFGENIVTVEDMWSPMYPHSGGTLREVTHAMTEPTGGNPLGAQLHGSFQAPAFRSIVEGGADTMEDIRSRRQEMQPQRGHIQEFDDIYNMSWDYRDGRSEIYDIEDDFIQGMADDIYNALDFDAVMERLMDLHAAEGKVKFTDEMSERAMGFALEDYGLPSGIVSKLPKLLKQQVTKVANTAMNMPIRYQEAKPQKALRFGAGQDVDFVIAPPKEGLSDEEADAYRLILDALKSKGVTVVESDGTGMAQVPDIYKFAAPPIVTYMGLKAAMEEERETEEKL